MLFYILIFLLGSIVGYFASFIRGLNSSVWHKAVFLAMNWKKTLSSPKDENRPAITGDRKYLKGTFEDSGRVYEFYLPYSRKLGMKDIKITGSTTGKVYNFNSAVLPAIKSRDFAEEKWIVEIDGQDKKIIETLENFSC